MGAQERITSDSCSFAGRGMRTFGSFAGRPRGWPFFFLSSLTLVLFGVISGFSFDSIGSQLILRDCVSGETDLADIQKSSLIRNPLAREVSSRFRAPCSSPSRPPPTDEQTARLSGNRAKSPKPAQLFPDLISSVPAISETDELNVTLIRPVHALIKVSGPHLRKDDRCTIAWCREARF